MVWHFHIMLSAQWPFEPAISFLGIYPRGMKTCLPEDLYSMFIAALITLEKTKTKNATKVHQWLNK